MSLDRLLTTNAVTIVKAGENTNTYTDRRPDWQFIESFTDTTGWLTQVTTTEERGAREIVRTGWKLYLAPDAVITAADRVLVAQANGCEPLIYEVDGQPHLAQTPRGPHHIECNLKRVTP